MGKNLQAVRGMNDVVPEESPYWARLEQACYDLAQRYGYQEIRFPIVESTELFKRTIGEVTDIVEKEMYTFTDRNGDSLTLRPEGTAGCVRAGIQQGLLYNQIQRFCYRGPMFRHERPQKGRTRQFHQFGIEAFGMEGPAVDVEQIIFCHRLWRELGIQDHVRLEINSLGTSESRQAYRNVLVSYFSDVIDQLDDDSKRRLSTNPLRILDSKNPEMAEIIANAPKLTEHLDEASQTQFARLQELLTALNIPFIVNTKLVRGLDYYCHTVYEWVTESLGAQGTICAGGRYDNLVEQLGGKATPACGFALGYERTVLLMQQVADIKTRVDVFMALLGEQAVTFGMQIAERLRNDLPHLNVIVNLAGGGFKGQFKRADKSGARWAFVIADDEVQAQKITVKSLREETEQQQFGYDELLAFVRGVEREPELNG